MDTTTPWGLGWEHGTFAAEAYAGGDFDPATTLTDAEVLAYFLNVPTSATEVLDTYRDAYSRAFTTTAAAIWRERGAPQGGLRPARTAPDLAEIISALRLVADGREEYASSHPPDEPGSAFMRGQAAAYRDAVALLEGGSVNDFVAAGAPSHRWPPVVRDAVTADDDAFADMADGWFNALGKPIPAGGREAARDLLVLNGCDPGEAALVIQLVAREVEHDEPDRAQRTLRNWLTPHGSETLLLMTLAYLCCPPGDDRHVDGEGDA